MVQLSQVSNLLLSPHPDDLVFSVFSIVSRPGTNNTAVIFFNVSRFTRWPLKSVKLVSVYRTLEDRLILGTLGVKSVTYLFQKDSSANSKGISEVIDLAHRFAMPSRMFCPLGIGENPNHVAVRQSAISNWVRWGKTPELYFYEDLPYAAKENDSEKIESEIVANLSRACDSKIVRRIQSPSSSQLAKKIYLSKAYFSQTDYSLLLETHAKIKGKDSETGFAEILFQAEPVGKVM